jgi:hypothetical protein
MSAKFAKNDMASPLFPPKVSLHVKVIGRFTDPRGNLIGITEPK